ncbi:MAG TPA: hypothetical protein VJK49_07620 [Candidatus Limnocylindrales bacterium]|nr:hypothetical protein [Candidatus Limnocylindrales bacterium]
MIDQASADQRRQRAMSLVRAAIVAHGGTTLLSTGITGDDARIARAAVAGGARMLEPNHPAVALRSGLRGVRSMHEAEAVRHLVPIPLMADVVRGVRAAVGPDIVITVGIPGAFEEVEQVTVRDVDLQLIADAGADGLHTHKADLHDLADWVMRAHALGLFVDAYIAHPNDRHRFGIPAAAPSDVAATVAKMRAMGVDLIGLMTGLSYEGVEAGAIPGGVRDRLLALVAAAADTPSIAEGGINPQNWAAVKATGVSVIVVGTAFDDIAASAVTDSVARLLA